MTAADLQGDPTLALPFAHGGPILHGRLRACDDDFQVEEVLGYGPSGSGEHVFLTLRKRGLNTHDVARKLARHAGVAQVAVGYAGLKDRNAVTTQSFTVQMPGQDTPDWRAVADDSLEIVEVARHHRKIRRGGLRGNRFVIRITDAAGDRDAVEQRLHLIATQGVPNYFGSQRFGRNGSNLARAEALFSGSGRRLGREQRGLILSAARSQLFNQVLAARVAGGNWGAGLDGDVMSLAGSGRQFHYDNGDASLPERIQQLDVHPTGPLCGRPSRSLSTAADCELIEREALAPWQGWIDGLTRFGLDADRRALRLAVDALDWSWQDRALTLSFELTAGAYATSVLRELVAPGEEPSEPAELA